MNKILYNKQYIYSTLLLCILTYLLNHCTAIYQCALVFTVVAITANALTYSYGKSRALKGVAVATMISFVLLWKLPYYVDGKIVNGLVFASLSSIMISMYWSTSVFQKLTSKFSIVTSNALSLVVATVIDGFVMGLFFSLNNNFSYERILDIFSRELSYKLIYGFIASAIILFVLKMFKTSKFRLQL
jgi:hypothetical protein